MPMQTSGVVMTGPMGPGAGVAGSYGGGGLAPATWGPDQEKIAKIQADAARYPYDLRNAHFNQIFPLIKGALGGFGAGGMGGPATAGGAQVGTQPYIGASPVWSPQQIQQKVNEQRAGADTATQSQQAQTARDAAGRGFSSQSPLTMALQGQEAGQGLATKVAGENQLRWGAAQGNAEQQLKGQQAREGQFAARQTEDIERRKPYFQLGNSLIAALGGMI